MDQGGAAALDVPAVFDAHRPALLGFAINAVRDRSLAEDCVQEAFERAWRSRDAYDARVGSPRTWLFAITRNVIIDTLRADRRAPLTADTDELERVPAAADDVLERLGLVEAIARLTPEHREVVVAIHVDGRSYTELAAETGIPIATLRTRTFYGLRALRGFLEERG